MNRWAGPGGSFRLRVNLRVPGKQRRNLRNEVSHKARAAGNSCCPGPAIPACARRAARFAAGVQRAPCQRRQVATAHGCQGIDPPGTQARSPLARDPWRKRQQLRLDVAQTRVTVDMRPPACRVVSQQGKACAAASLAACAAGQIGGTLCSASVHAVTLENASLELVGDSRAIIDGSGLRSLPQLLQQS